MYDLDKACQRTAMETLKFSYRRSSMQSTVQVSKSPASFGSQGLPFFSCTLASLLLLSVGLILKEKGKCSVSAYSASCVTGAPALAGQERAQQSSVVAFQRSASPSSFSGLWPSKSLLTKELLALGPSRFLTWLHKKGCWNLVVHDCRSLPLYLMILTPLVAPQAQERGQFNACAHSKHTPCRDTPPVPLPTPCVPSTPDRLVGSILLVHHSSRICCKMMPCRHACNSRCTRRPTPPPPGRTPLGY